MALLAAAAGATAQTAPMVGGRPQQMLGVKLNVGDFDRSRDFYLSVVGLKENAGSAPGGSPVRLSSFSFSGAYDDTFLMIIGDPGKPPPAKGGGLANLVFKVSSVHAVVDRARKAGSPVLHEPASAHGMASLVVGVIQDPDGNAVELVGTSGN